MNSKSQNRLIRLGRLGWLGAVLGVSAALAGCDFNVSGSFKGGSSSTIITGKDVSGVWERIHRGDTREQVVIVLGEPGEKIAGLDGTEIWRWAYSEKRDAKEYRGLTQTVHKTSQVEKTHVIEIKDGVVINLGQTIVSTTQTDGPGAVAVGA